MLRGILRHWPYDVERTGFRPKIAVKRRWEWLVLGWVTEGCWFDSRCVHWDISLT